jgi:hypothetical protein
MFGSLVIVFPTEHEGGALVLRHGEREWTFDSATEVKNHTDPSFAYIAFYSDVEHEVAPVTSGYRVTLTYNLYFVSGSDTPSGSLLPIASDAELAFKAALSALLSDGTFMDKGGYLGFGLRHEYPINPTTDLANLIKYLKGSDAVIQRACTELSLSTSLRVIYKDDDLFFVMVDHVADFSTYGEIDSNIGEMLIERKGGQRVNVTGPVARGRQRYHGFRDDRADTDPSVEVVWVTDLTKFTYAKTPYVAYGNEASLSHVRETLFLSDTMYSQFVPDVWQSLSHLACRTSRPQGDRV